MYNRKAYSRHLILCILSTLFISAVAVAQPLSKDDSSSTSTVQPGYDKKSLAERLKYPEVAVRDGIEGEVIVRALVDKKGRVEDAKVDQSPNQVLNDAALEAVRKTTFTPAMQQGKPVSVWIQIPVQFSLRDTKGSSQSTASRPKEPVEVEPGYDSREIAANVRYPELARRRGIEGDVIINALIAKDGRVADIKVHESDSPLLETAAIEAVRNTKFTPATEDGVPVAVWIQIPIVFRLNDGPADTAEGYIPSIDEFVPVEQDVSYSIEELQKNIVYPEEARKNNIEGIVVVRLLIGKSGRVLDGRMESYDHEILRLPAIEALKKTTFKPAMRGGQPLASWIQIPIVFRLP